MIAFHKTSLKLTSVYLLIIMLISISFSLALYHVSASELDRGSRRPLPSLEGMMNSNDIPYIRNQLNEQRMEFYEEAKQKLIQRLVVVNIIVLVSGGILSYLLAVRTLKPIEDAHEAQSEFAANASHELRTPITAMRAENEVALLDDSLTVSDAKLVIASNVEELEKLSVLSETLLHIAKTENVTLDMKQLHVRDILQSVFEQFENIANSKDISIDLRCKKGLSCMGEYQSLREIVSILVDNAIKYSPKNTKIVLAATQQGSQVVISVKDQGIGIDPTQSNQIFDRFYRVDSSRNKDIQSGYGLGLAIAKNLAQSNNAKLDVESLIGKGSTFTLTVAAAPVTKT